MSEMSGLDADLYNNADQDIGKALLQHELNQQANIDNDELNLEEPEEEEEAVKQQQKKQKKRASSSKKKNNQWDQLACLLGQEVSLSTFLWLFSLWP